jgi:acyl-[acyl-carrier-protein] desaturase
MNHSERVCVTGKERNIAVKRSATACIEELFFESYLQFFQRAEEKRRWNIERDIPWDKVNPEASELTALIVQFFSAVEMYLPDYTAKMMQMIRRSRGRAWFHANWGYEESKHSLVLEDWLLRSGKRTEEQLRDFERTLLLGEEWELPFDHPRQMIIYTMIQERATGLNYTNLRRRAEGEGDLALAGLLRWVAADESAHYNFYRKGVKAYLALEPEETIADVKFVFDQFAMPGRTLIPGWDDCSKAIDAAGIYGPRMYLQKIRQPILEDLGIPRQLLRRVGLPEAVADTMADRADERSEDLTQAAFARSHFPPQVPAPLDPPGRKVIHRIP